ncbi:MAG: DMT family transporter [Bacteroidia bacterium]|nr:DMT family transporter [Bacteroidia bacterium]NNC86500.1 EamA family transporter [Bacteroidia bacterium]
MKGNNTKAHLAVLSANLLYGANYSIAKIAMPEYILPYAFITIRVCIAAILYFFLFKIIVKTESIKGKYKKFMLLALFGIAINQLLFFKGLSLTTPINAALIMTTNPITVLIIASVFLKERITKLKISGILLGIIGAASLILYGNQLQMSQSNALGDLFIFINSISFAIFLVLAKPIMKQYQPLTVMFWLFFFGIFMVTPFGVGELKQVDWSTLPTHAYLSIGYVVLGTTLIAYLCNLYALKNLNASTVSTYIYLQPVFATLFALLFGKDIPNVLHLLAAVLIFTGVYLVSKPTNAVQKPRMD